MLRVRYALVRLRDAGCLHLADPGSRMDQEQSFPSSRVTEVEADTRSYNEAAAAPSTARALAAWLGPAPGPEDARVVQFVCALVSERCAALASVCVAELCSRNDKVTWPGHAATRGY